MFSATNSGSRRSFKADLKFSLIFGTIFWITALILYAFVFIYIYSSLRQDTRTGIQVRMLGYWAIDQSGGLETLRNSIDVNMILSDELSFFVRISDEFNNTIMLDAPERWQSFDYSKLEKTPPRPGAYILLKSDSLDFVLETGCIKLTDGNFLQVGMGDENRRRVMDLLGSSFFLAFIILIAVSLILGFIVASRFLQPIRDLESAVSEIIRTGRIESRIVERKGAGELDELIVSFNQMLQKIEDLVVGMKGALDTVAHDLRTPLTRFRMISEKALSRHDSGDSVESTAELRSALEAAMVESDTVLRMMTLLMDISEAETGTLKLNKTEFSPVERVRNIIDVYELAAEGRGISIEVEEPSYGGTIYADPDRFMQAAGNLIDNAVKYGRDGGRVKVRITEDNGWVSIRVEDDGDGITAEDLPEIWKRLYRGKSSKDGLGLGLSLVNAIMKSHGGTVAVESKSHQGSAFLISFPPRNRGADTSLK